MPSSWRTLVFLVLSMLWISCVLAEMVKRAAIISPPPKLFESDNDIDSIFVTKKTRYNHEREGRMMVIANETESSSTTKSAPSSAEHEDVGTSRKASPDVQDIIDGIVKLLGGKVHQTGPTPTAPPTRQPQPSLLPAAYNLFNPSKTVKPSRINNRGPPVLPDPVLPNLEHGRPYDNRGQQQQQQQQQQLQQQQQQYHHQAQYQYQPQQQPMRHDDRPPLFDRQPMTENRPLRLPHTTEQHQHQQQQRPGMIPDRAPIVRFPESRPQSSGRPGTTFEAIPIELLGDFDDNKTKFGPPFPLPSHPPFSNTNNNNRPSGPIPIPGGSSAEAPYRKGIPLPEQLVPPKYGSSMEQTGHSGNHNGNWPKVPSPPTIPPIVTEEAKIIPNNKEPQSTPLPATTKKYTSLLVPVDPQPTTPSEFSSPEIEDDEAEEEIINIHLEPSGVKEGSSLIEIEPNTITSSSNLWPSESSSASSDHSSHSSTLEYSVLEASSSSSSSLTPSISSVTSITIEPSVVAVPHLQTEQNNPSTTTATTSSSTSFYENSGSSSSSTPTPPLRPGVVINDTPLLNTAAAGRPVPTANQGFGSVEVVTAEGHGQIGDVFDVTVTAKQNYGGQVTGQPFIIPVDLKEDVITRPQGNDQFVQIDGKRQYFNLHQNTPAVVGSVAQTSLTINGNNKNNNQQQSHIHNPAAIRPVSTTLNIASNPVGTVSATSAAAVSSTNGNNNNNSKVNKVPPNIIRRPLTRKPSVPPVRIDTCIVGDDSTCNSEQSEICRTESGVSSCVCRAGYARRRHREPCKPIVTMSLSMKLDKLGDKKLQYNPEYFNPNSEIYQTLEWETIHALDSSLADTTLQGQYVGARLEAIGFDGRHAVVNSTVLIQENPKFSSNHVKRELQKQLIQSLTRNRNNFGKSQLWVEGPISSVAAITDVNECENPDMNDCDEKARCVNTFGSFECKCEPGYGDPHEKDKRLSGRKCETCSGKSYCNGRGECSIEKGQRVCKCSGNYYGSQCDIDGEVLAVAIGASISAVVIIGLTLACLCMWSRRWKREEQKAAIISRTLFGGMASQALNYLSKNTMNSSNNPYQQHVTMDDRLRWAQVADTNLGGNIYVPNEPMSMCSGPPMMDSRRSVETVDTTVDDMFDVDRHPTKRPRSRSSQMQSGGIYYDLEPQSEMYASSPMVPFPAQFCVPSMNPSLNPYVHRSYYN